MMKKYSMSVLKATAKTYGIKGLSKYKEANREELEALITEARKNDPEYKEEAEDIAPVQGTLHGAEDKGDLKEVNPKAPKTAKKDTKKPTKKESTALAKVHFYNEVNSNKISLDQFADQCKRVDLTTDQRYDIMQKMNSGIGARAIFTGFLLISTELKGGELHEHAELHFNIKKTQCNVYVRVANKLGDRLEEVKDLGINELIELCKEPKEEGEEEENKKVKSATIIKALEKLETSTALDIEISSDDTKEAFLEEAERLIDMILANCRR